MPPLAFTALTHACRARVPSEIDAPTIPDWVPTLPITIGAPLATAAPAPVAAGPAADGPAAPVRAADPALPAEPVDPALPAVPWSPPTRSLPALCHPGAAALPPPG